MGKPAVPRPELIISHFIIGAVPSDSRRDRLIRRLLEMRLVGPGAIFCRGAQTPEMVEIQASISQGSGVGNRECRLAAEGRAFNLQASVARPFQAQKRILAAFKIAAP